MYYIKVECKTLEGLKDEVLKLNEELGIEVTKKVKPVDRGPSFPGVDFNTPADADIPTLANLDTVNPTIDAAAALVEVPTFEQVLPAVHPVPNNKQLLPVGDLDSENLPWDKRIHTAAKTQTKQGTWKLKRGVDPALVQQVKAELLQSQAPAAPIPAAPISATTPVVTPVLEAPDTVAPVLTAPAVLPTNSPVLAPPATAAVPALAPAPTAAPVPAAPLATPSGHSVETFVANFPMILGALLTEGKVTEQYCNELKAYFKVEQIWDITDAQKADVFKSFVGFGFIQQVA